MKGDAKCHSNVQEMTQGRSACMNIVRGYKVGAQSSSHDYALFSTGMFRLRVFHAKIT
jgi:hypothetical protein